MMERMWGLMGWRRSNRLIVRIAWGLVLVALVTAAIALARNFTDASNVAIVYVIAVLAAAVTAGSVAAVVAAVVSFFAYDLFFIAPYFVLSVANPVEWVNLALLLTTGVVTGQLAGLAHRRELEARANEHSALVQYEVARALSDDDTERGLHTAADVLREAMGVDGVLIRAPIGGDELTRPRPAFRAPCSRCSARAASAAGVCWANRGTRNAAPSTRGAGWGSARRRCGCAAPPRSASITSASPVARGDEGSDLARLQRPRGVHRGRSSGCSRPRPRRSGRPWSARG